MEYFLTTLISVAIMLAYALPGFLFVKLKKVSQDSISAFAKLLMYICQPFLTIYSFNKILVDAPDVSISETMKSCGIVFGLSIGIMMFLIFIFYMIYNKKLEDVKYRIATIAVAFGNCTFMGIPILEALFPSNPEVALYSTIFFISMSILGWTIGSSLIARDKKYIKIKNILLNPAIIALVIALPLFLTKTVLPSVLDNMVTILGKMSTPLCMIIIGMRFGTVPIKPIFTDPLQYISMAVKLIAMPLLMILVVYFMPIDVTIQKSLIIMAACPCAAVVLTFSELIGQGQDKACNIILLTTLLSVVTLPLICMLTDYILPS